MLNWGADTMDVAVDLECGQSECDGRLVRGATNVSMPEQSFVGVSGLGSVCGCPRAEF
jgi:hypothetical protein